LKTIVREKKQMLSTSKPPTQTSTRVLYAM